MQYIFEYWYRASDFVVKRQGIKNTGINFVYLFQQNFFYKKYKGKRFAIVNIYNLHVCNFLSKSVKVTKDKQKGFFEVLSIAAIKWITAS